MFHCEAVALIVYLKHLLEGIEIKVKRFEAWCRLIVEYTASWIIHVLLLWETYFLASVCFLDYSLPQPQVFLKYFLLWS